MIRNTSRNNTNWKKVGGGLLAMLLTVYLAGCNSQSGNANQSAAATPTASPAAPAPDATFKEAAMTWNRVEESRAKLDAALDGKNLAGAREPAARMRDSLNALPSQSMAMPSDKREQLTAQVKNVERMVGMLDEAAVANNADSVHEHHKAMDESLNAIKGLYPAGVMPASTHMDDGMHGKGMGMHGADKKMGDMPGKKGGMKMPMKDH